MKKFDGYLSQIVAILDGAYSQGYDAGFEKAKAVFGEHDRGIARFQRATEEEIKIHVFDLAGWCVECERPIEGRWIGMANFCPWCGRVIKWVDDSEKEADHA